MSMKRNPRNTTILQECTRMLYHRFSGNITSEKELISQKCMAIYPTIQEQLVLQITTHSIMPITDPVVVLRLQWCLAKCGKCSQSIMSIKWYSFFPNSQRKVFELYSFLVNGLQLQVLPPFHLLFILKLVIFSRYKSDPLVVEQISGDSSTQ